MNASIPSETIDALNREIADLRAKLASASVTAELFFILDDNSWRVDIHREDGTCRCMYWCVECGLFRPVVDTGAWFPDLATAVRAAADAEL